MCIRNTFAAPLWEMVSACDRSHQNGPGPRFQVRVAVLWVSWCMVTFRPSLASTPSFAISFCNVACSRSVDDTRCLGKQSRHLKRLGLALHLLTPVACGDGTSCANVRWDRDVLGCPLCPSIPLASLSPHRKPAPSEYRQARRHPTQWGGRAPN